MVNNKDSIVGAHAILRQALNDNHATFHEHQLEAILALVDKRQRMLVIQRTGWGKSAVYFIATYLMRKQGYGPTIIISPLLALMRNQIFSAAKYGVNLGTINSSNSEQENTLAIKNLLENKLDAIVISPEQLSKPNFTQQVLLPIANRIGLFVIDEAHCISDWGHDFRPDYKRIVNILSYLPVNMPVLATTATANQRVMDDISAQMGKGVAVLRGNLTRESLRLQNIYIPKRSQRLAWLADILLRLRGTGIIYTSTTADAELVTKWLKTRGLVVEAYYGSIDGLSKEENRVRRLELEDALLKNKVKALVATSALGMGYDKPDLEFVIHFQTPGSVVAYYQQVGRAGRAIPNAYGILLAGDEDDDIQQYFISQSFPKERLVVEILQSLEQAADGLKPSELASVVNGSAKKIDAALKYLAAESPSPIAVSQQNPIKYSRTINQYHLPREKIARLSEIKSQEWAVMNTYLAHKGCLMQFLANQLDDPFNKPCGRCAYCDPKSALTIEYSHSSGVAAEQFLNQICIDIPPRKIVNVKDFPKYGLPRDLAVSGLTYETGRVLCRFGEAGWGAVAKAGKLAGKFDSSLVLAAADMIRNQWKPLPFPAWIAFVPSHRHPNLVANFAFELADRLGIPCIDVVKKVVNNQQQKFMQNSNFRCRNLDGVFQINGPILNGPVLLIDDAVDSRWTFTVVSALLRRAGVSQVFPFAIMSTSTHDE